MKTSLKTAVYLFTWLHMSATFCCGVSVFFVDISPKEPINGENATLTCAATGYNLSLHRWVWQKRINGTLVDITANERIAFLPIQQESPTYYSSTVAINRLEESDEGDYLCVVVEKRTRDIISNGASEFFVNYPNEFPVCNPSGPAAVTERDSLSCKTVIEERTPDVRRSDDNSATRLDWISTTVRKNVSGSELVKNVTIADDGLIFYCYSILGDVRKTLSCRIGPLTVIPYDIPYTTSPKTKNYFTPTINRDKFTTSPRLSSDCPPSSIPSVCITGIAGIAFGVFVIVVSICINLLCFRYDPKRLCKLIGFCSQSKTPSGQSGPNDPSNLQMDRRLYESSITGPARDQPERIEYSNVEVNVGLSTEHPTPHGGSVELPMDPAVPPSGRSRQSAQDAVKSVEDPSYDWPARSAHEDNQATGKPTDGYIELQGKPKTGVYTDLKL